MTDEIRVHAETLKSGSDLLSLSPSTMILDVGGVIGDQYACVPNSPKSATRVSSTRSPIQL